MLRFGGKRAKPSVITLADRARDQGRWERAAGYYRKALQRRPQNSPIWVQYGHVLKESGRLTEAERAYGTALAYDPRSADSYLQLGRVLKLQDKREQAAAAYLRALVLDPSFNAASLELKQLGWSEAHLSEVYQMSRMLSPTPSGTSGVTNLDSQGGKSPYLKLPFLLGSHLFSKRFRVRRMHSLILSSSRRGRQIKQLIGAGDKANRRRLWAKAEDYYREALALDSSLKHIWVQYGHALKEQGSLKDGETAYRRSLALDPNLPDTHLQLGHVLKLQRRIEEAVAAYLRSHELDPTNPHSKTELIELGVIPPNPKPKFRRDDRFIKAVYGSEKPLYLSPGHLLHSHLLGDNVLTIFDFQYYFNLNPAVAQALNKPNRYRCLVDFCERGHQELFQINQNYLFDPDFYVATYLDQPFPPPMAYRHWLNVGYGRVWHPNKINWIKSRLELSQLDNFDVALDSILTPREIGTRWADWVDSFIDDHVLKAEAHLPVTAMTADFFAAIADRFAVNGRDDAALTIYQRILQSMPDHQRTLSHYSDCLMRMRAFLPALEGYKKLIACGGTSSWLFLNLATCQEETGSLLEALGTLEGGTRAFPGRLEIRQRFEAIAERYFEREWHLAFGMSRIGRNTEAQQRLRAVCEVLTSKIIPLKPLPPRAIRVIAIVGIHSLPQCFLYRIQQKADHLRWAGYDVSVYDSDTEISAFMSNLYRFDAVIFYRVPATPRMVQLIAKSKELGVTTFYDIDDMIFDYHDYPPSFDSFKDLISRDDYIGLQLGVPLHRSAISLCDFSIASTPSLARRLAQIVGPHRVFVQRNGFGKLHEQLALPSPGMRKRQKVTIFYGSGTKSHKEDFQELVEPALVEMVKRYGDKITIILVGYTARSQKLDSIRSNIRFVEPIWDIAEYWSHLHKADINIAPLKTSPMADCKSEIKWLEAAMFGVPSVVSGTETYREAVEHGVTGFICDTPEEWTAAIDLLVKDASLRYRLGATAWRRVRDNYSIPAMAKNLSCILEPLAAIRVKKPTILIVNVFYPPQSFGGATRVVHDNVAHFMQAYHDDFHVEIFTTVESEGQDYEVGCYVHDGVRVTSVTRPSDPEIEKRVVDEKMGELFGKFIDQIRPDLIHFHCIQRLTVSIVSATRQRNIPYVITAHDGWWISDLQFIVDDDDELALFDYSDPLAVMARRGKAAYSRLMKLKEPLAGARKILAVSDKFARLYESCGLMNVASMPNGIFYIATAHRKSSADGLVRLGLIGADRIKGYHLVRQAVAHKKFSRLRLKVVDLSLNPGQRRTEIWNGTRVEFVSRFPPEKVAELYAGIDVLLAPSTCIESFGLVTREALHCGCWIVASDRGSIGECVVEGKNGHIIDVSSANDLIRVLTMIDHNPERYREPPPTGVPLRKAADQADELVAIYKSIIGPADAVEVASPSQRSTRENIAAVAATAPADAP
jgi:glycosyltransferase involved in cell wall biosynthesis/Tfp pilus assembly protein PilF